jgi:hypothetical protein
MMTISQGVEASMSLLSMGKGYGKTNGATTVPPEVGRYAPKPRPQPLQLGAKTMQAVDEITDMSAAEIEQVADEVEAAAHETAEGLREAARRVRSTGAAANRRLANFVRAAATCVDAAEVMRESVRHRDDPQIEPPRQQTDHEAPAAVMNPSAGGETLRPASNE